MSIMFTVYSYGLNQNSIGSHLYITLSNALSTVSTVIGRLLFSYKNKKVKICALLHFENLPSFIF